MLLAEEFIRAIGKGIESIHFALTGVITRATYIWVGCAIWANHHAAVFIYQSIQVKLLTLEVHFRVRAVNRELPVIAQFLLQSDESTLRFFVVVSPVRGRAVAAVRVSFAAIGVPTWNTAPGRAIHVGFLIVITD